MKKILAIIMCSFTIFSQLAISAGAVVITEEKNGKCYIRANDESEVDWSKVDENTIVDIIGHLDGSSVVDDIEPGIEPQAIFAPTNAWNFNKGDYVETFSASSSLMDQYTSYFFTGYTMYQVAIDNRPNSDRLHYYILEYPGSIFPVENDYVPLDTKRYLTAKVGSSLCQMTIKLVPPMSNVEVTVFKP